MSSNNSSQQQNQQPTIDQVIQNIRDNILRTQSNASTASITGFDQLVEQLKVFSSVINDRNTEIVRLQAILVKNKIDYSIPPQTQPVVKLPENKAVIPPTVEKVKPKSS